MSLCALEVAVRAQHREIMQTRAGHGERMLELGQATQYEIKQMQAQGASHVERAERDPTPQALFVEEQRRGVLDEQEAAQGVDLPAVAQRSLREQPNLRQAVEHHPANRVGRCARTHCRGGNERHHLLIVA